MISFGGSDTDRGDQRDSAFGSPVPNTPEAISVASTVPVRTEDAETRVVGSRSERSETQRRERETTVDPVGREEVVEVPRVPTAADDAVRDGSGCTTPCATHTTGRDYLPKNSTQRDLVEKKEDDLSLGPTDLVPGDPGPLSEGSQGLLHLNPMWFVDELLAGKKLKAGDNHKGWLLDLSLLGPVRDLPQGELKRGLADLVRVVATNNRAVVMVEAWDLEVVGLVDSLHGWKRVQAATAVCGLRRLTLKRVRRGRTRRETSVPPPTEADVCVLTVDLDEGVVHALREGRPVPMRAPMESPAMAIGRAEAVASAVDGLDDDLVALHMSAAPLLVPLLLCDTAGSNIGLARAVSRLTRSRDWSWAREGHWLIGRRRRPSTPRPSRLK